MGLVRVCGIDYIAQVGAREIHRGATKARTNNSGISGVDAHCAVVAAHAQNAGVVQVSIDVAGGLQTVGLRLQSPAAVDRVGCRRAQSVIPQQNTSAVSSQAAVLLVSLELVGYVTIIAECIRWAE